MDPDPASLFCFVLALQNVSELALNPLVISLQVITLLILILASALFSGSEVALFSLDTAAKEALSESGDRAGARVLELLNQPRQILVTILILNTVVNVGAGIIAALMVAEIARAMAWSHTLTLILEMAALTFVLLVISEISPKLLATRDAKSFSRKVSGMLLVFHRILSPVSGRLAETMSFMQNRIKNNQANRLSAEDLKTMAEIGETHGTLEEEERDLIHSIVEFSETSVREIMVSRLDIVALPVTATLNEALDLIRTSGHSRLPLYVEHLDNILGIIYAKDLLPFVSKMNGSTRVDWTRIARPPMFVPMGKMLDNLLRDFQARKTHMAIVVDEYGGTAGLVTMEDVLEEIVGDIRDEHDEAEHELYERIDEETFRVDARINLDDLNEILEIDLDTEHFDFETLGGLIFHVTGAIPNIGDEAVYEPLHMKVETVENHRIGSVLVRVARRLEDEEIVSEGRLSDEE